MPQCNTLNKKLSNCLTRNLTSWNHFDLCDIWRFRNPDAKQLNFSKTLASRFTQRKSCFRLLCGIINWSLSSNHFDFKKQKLHPWSWFLEIQQFFAFRPKYVRNLNNLIQTFQRNQNFIPNTQLKRIFLKYEIRKFTINYSKKLSKEWKVIKTLLEKKLKELEDNLNTE